VAGGVPDTAPRVYVEETSYRSKPIAGVPTSAGGIPSLAVGVPFRCGHIHRFRQGAAPTARAAFYALIRPQRFSQASSSGLGAAGEAGVPIGAPI
jgi:hypothetical protein